MQGCQENVMSHLVAQSGCDYQLGYTIRIYKTSPDPSSQCKK